MKKVYIVAFLQFLSFGLLAQIDRTKAPKPAAAREIKIGDYQAFTLKNGLQVFVVENHKLPRLALSVSLKTEAILEGEKAGYSTIAGDLIGTGTTTRKKAQLDEEIDFIGATLSTSATGLSAASLSKHTNKLFELATDVLINPSFEQAELDKLKTQTLSGITASKDDPNAIASNVRGALVYGKNHPYGEIATEKSVGSITLDDCKSYYNTYFKPSNAYLIIVGDIELKDAKTLAEKYFSKWVSGVTKEASFTSPQAPAKTIVALVDRPASVQSVINVSYPVDLKPGPPDAIRARVTNEILGGGFSSRLMQNLREKHGFTYGARSQLISDALVGNFSASASVRNEVTDSSVFEFVSELKRITTDLVTEKELQDAKASISGAFGRSLENPQTIAGFALNTAKYNLPKDYYNNYLKAVDGVTTADVLATAKKFIRPNNAYIVVVGKGSDVAEKLKRFGEVKYYDIEGNSYVPSKSAALPAGLSAERVISNYIQAIGGEAKIREIKSLKATYKATAMGMQINMMQTKKAPNKSLTEVTGNGMTFSKIIFDGKGASMSAMGQKAPDDAKVKEKAAYESAIVPEMFLTGIKTNLLGIESVDGSEAYAVEFVSASGEKTTVYFDKSSGLKVQQTQTVQGPQGILTVTIKYQDYKDVNGVKLPYSILQSQGPLNFKFEAVSVEANAPVDDAVFKLE